MKQPIIIAVDDDPQVLRALSRDLRSTYRKEYKILSTESASEALNALKELKKKNETVAMLISDQRMPEMLGVDYLSKAKKEFPEAKRVLLTAYSDTDAAIKAINDVQLDYYLMKPWDPPEEKMFPVLNDLLEAWQNNYTPDYEGLRVIGFQFSPKSHDIKDFLSGNLFPYQWMDAETSDKAKELLVTYSIDMKDLPVVLLEDGTYLKDPSVTEIAERLGLKPHASAELYDVVIIGAGPAGLSAAVYGGSEGLKTLLIEKRAPGGQAGTSSRIENYLGFPSGLSGSDLSRRAITQATRFGVEFLSPAEVVDIELQDNYKILTLSTGAKINTRSLIIATGVDYRKLDTKGVSDFTGAGVYYGAATTEANGCRDREVFVVGGGNSAGQGAMYLSQYAKTVYLVIRRPDLTETMSHYLIDQIKDTPNIRLLPCSEIVEARGNGHLQELDIKELNSGNIQTLHADSLFIFIGAKPFTDWMPINLFKDPRGFIETGRNLFLYSNFKKSWKLEREPYPLETCVPGIFASGDVRATAMNRVASAVGEGAMAISFVHKYLAEI
ncbi:FAD-dependent oxidoreductase [Cytophagaceae bacterium DM2B3-1]|uniref:FAD-dependent oxidoreductase n=1 Tax=Xanthocytophaga flava TaxID=3048013 RepID=A0ABT7CWC6_9BACT|nr:FAD-dependent oxidoreductase [Xanthocytophaga flavus]MDJ1498073.1 FAD-dependent oxidoreductase [Xanthocytophaga flavus]